MQILFKTEKKIIFRDLLDDHRRRLTSAVSRSRFDADEHGLSNWTIYLDENGNGQHNPGEPTTQTNTLGQYVFTNLTPGTHVVREVPQTGWLPTSPSTGNHTLSLGGREHSCRDG